MEDVLTSAEKKAPMYMEQLQKGYWLCTSECTSVCAFLENLAFPMNFPEFMSEPLWNILLKISFPTGYWQSVKEDCPCILKTIDSYFNKNVIWLKIWFLLNICDRHQRPTVLCLSDLDVSPQVVGLGCESSSGWSLFPYAIFFFAHLIHPRFQDFRHSSAVLKKETIQNFLSNMQPKMKVGGLSSIFQQSCCNKYIV